MKDFKQGGKIGSENRFTSKNPLYKSDFSPGPAAYDMQPHKSISTATTQRSKSINKLTQESFMGSEYSTFGLSYTQLYKPESSFKTPGPGSYNNEESFRKTHTNIGYSFSKNDRDNYKSTGVPGPDKFQPDSSFNRIAKKDLMVKIGKAKREIDFTKCKFMSLYLDSSQHAQLVNKGIY